MTSGNSGQSQQRRGARLAHLANLHLQCVIDPIYSFFAGLQQQILNKRQINIIIFIIFPFVESRGIEPPLSSQPLSVKNNALPELGLHDGVGEESNPSLTGIITIAVYSPVPTPCGASGTRTHNLWRAMPALSQI